MVDDTGYSGNSGVSENAEKAADPGAEEKFELSVKDALNALSVAVQAGYSVENAVSACAGDLGRIYPQDADIVKEFRYMEGQLKVSVPVEALFQSLGERSGIEDMENFAAVFIQPREQAGI